MQPLPIHRNNREAELHPRRCSQEVGSGEVTLLCAAHENHEHVSVLSDLKGYKPFVSAWNDGKGDVGESASCAEGVRDDSTIRRGNQASPEDRVEAQKPAQAYHVSEGQRCFVHVTAISMVDQIFSGDVVHKPLATDVLPGPIIKLRTRVVQSFVHSYRLVLLLS